MSKKVQTPLGIFMESTGLYFSNFTKFMKYMTFPVLGQIAGLLLAFLCTYVYAVNMPQVIEKYPNFNNFSLLLTLSILICLPGLAIFIKAFWEYLVAYGAINSMCENMMKSGKVYDFDAHTELIKRRVLPFVGLWFLFGIFSLISICPLFWVICGILAVYFVLSFQVFTFEPELNPINCVIKSMKLVKGRFVSTFMLISLAGALTYIFIPQIMIKITQLTGMENIISDIFLPFISLFELSNLQNPTLEKFGITIPTDKSIAIFAVQTFIAQILIQYTLPLRSILWTLWYKELNGAIPYQEKPKKTSKKRPSEKLMEESHKKFGTKKLDRNILKRASEKED